MTLLVSVADFVSRRRLWVATALHALAIVALAASLPPDAWFVGDPGTKLVAARDAAAHPSRPLESSLPPIEAADAEDYRQPFFVPHGDHAHAFTSPLFPLATAPFLGLFGVRGLYVLPALGWLLLPPLTLSLARRLQLRASSVAVWIATAAMTPFVFYGLEFWEHAPAVAALVGAMCLAFGAPTDRGDLTTPTSVALVTAGVVSAMAILLRPESVWAVGAIVMVLWLRATPAQAIRSTVLLAVGGAIGVLPQAAYHLTHFGTLTPEHVSGNLAGLAGDWRTERLDFANIWLGIHRGWTRVAASLLIFGAIVGRVDRRRRWPLVVGMIGAAGLAFEFARGHELRENLWRVLPIGLIALLPPGRSTTARRALWILTIVPVIGVVLTAPNDGGGQWGPRYLLAIVPPLLLLAFNTVRHLSRRVGARAAFAFVAFMLAAAMRVSFTAYDELRATKTFYSEMVADTVGAAAGHHVLTNVWWVPQVNAAVLDPARVLWVNDAAKGARWLAGRPGLDVLLIRLADAPDPLDDWTRGTCYRPVREERSRGGLLYTALNCR